MTDDEQLRAQLEDAALVHAVGTEISAAAAVLEQRPLDERAVARMRHVLADRIVPAQLALGRFHEQDPPPGVVSVPRVLRVVGTSRCAQELGGGAA